MVDPKELEFAQQLRDLCMDFSMKAEMWHECDSEVAGALQGVADSLEEAACQVEDRNAES